MPFLLILIRKHEKAATSLLLRDSQETDFNQWTADCGGNTGEKPRTRGIQACKSGSSNNRHDIENRSANKRSITDTAR